jgi:hypothetical protein
MIAVSSYAILIQVQGGNGRDNGLHFARCQADPPDDRLRHALAKPDAGVKPSFRQPGQS